MAAQFPFTQHKLEFLTGLRSSLRAFSHTEFWVYEKLHPPKDQRLSTHPSKEHLHHQVPVRGEKSLCVHKNMLDSFCRVQTPRGSWIHGDGKAFSGQITAKPTLFQGKAGKQWVLTNALS